MSSIEKNKDIVLSQRNFLEETSPQKENSGENIRIGIFGHSSIYINGGGARRVNEYYISPYGEIVLKLSRYESDIPPFEEGKCYFIQIVNEDMETSLMAYVTIDMARGECFPPPTYFSHSLFSIPPNGLKSGPQSGSQSGLQSRGNMEEKEWASLMYSCLVSPSYMNQMEWVCHGRCKPIGGPIGGHIEVS